MAWSISCRYLRASSRIKQFAGPLDAFEEIRVSDSAQYDEVDRSAEQCLEVGLQPEKVLGVLARAKWRKVDEEVDVAFRAQGARRSGPEKLQAAHMVPTAQRLDLGTQVFELIDHRTMLRWPLP
jgi:hypothetical protein